MRRPAINRPPGLGRSPIPMLAIVFVVAASIALAACSVGASSSSASSPSASTGSGPSAPTSVAPGSVAPGSVAPGGRVETPEQAAAVVLALDPRFAAIGPKDPELIGQAAWYVVDPGPGDAWTVQVRIGWGDCPSGCINEHTWTYEVARDGTPTLMSETGPEVPPEAVPSS